MEIREGRQAIGLRFIEPARDRFFTELIVKRIPHKEIIRFAQKVLCPELAAVGYGFQYRFGTVLPAAIGESPTTANPSLLRWHCIQLLSASEAGGMDAVVFHYEQADYGTAPRNWIDSPGKREVDEGITASFRFSRDAAVVPRIIEPGHALLALCLTDLAGNHTYLVDMGQVLRGQRYMYRPEINSAAVESLAETGVIERSGWFEHEAADILSISGLVDSNRAGIHYISAEGNTLLLLGLLGKLFPQNVG